MSFKADSPLNRIDETVSFVKELLDKYAWGESERASIDRDLEFIDKKRNDKYLNLSIVGEFSSAKSTFINALLRDNLLESDNIQGTTIAKTVIRYARKYDVIVNFKDGKAERYSKTKRFYWVVWLIIKLVALFHPKKNDPRIMKSAFGVSHGELKQRITELTTNPTIASQVQEVIIEHPAEVLKRGITIIDTPGTNSLESWHEDVTKEAIREISDVSVILTSADKPLPNTLNEFIKENLSDVLGHCIFVATKMDVLREKERERQLAYIKQKASDEFRLTDPIILPYTPMFVLGESDASYKTSYLYEKDDYQRLIDESINTEKAIFQRLAHQRVTIQVQKLSSILEQTLSHLLISMTQRSETYKERHAILEKHQKPDFAEFINGMKDKYLIELKNKYDSFNSEMLKKIRSLANTQIDSFKDQLFAVPNKEELEPFCSVDYIRKWLTDNATELIRNSHDQFHQFSGIANTVMKDFGIEFSKIYSELATLDIKNVNINYGTNSNNLGIASLESENLKQMLSIIKPKNDNDNSMVMPGILLGNLVVPFIGGLIGGAIGEGLGKIKNAVGGFFKMLFGPSLATIKKDIWVELHPIISQSYKKFDDYIVNDTNNKFAKLREHVMAQIEEYFSAYRKFIAAMILQDKEEKEKLESYINMIEADKAEIANRQQIIMEMR